MGWKCKLKRKHKRAHKSNMLNENEHQQAQAQQEEKNSDTSPCTYDCIAAFFTGKVSCCPCVCRE